MSRSDTEQENKETSGFKWLIVILYIVSTILPIVVVFLMIKWFLQKIEQPEDVNFGLPITIFILFVSSIFCSFILRRMNRIRYTIEEMQVIVLPAVIEDMSSGSGTERDYYKLKVRMGDPIYQSYTLEVDKFLYQAKTTGDNIMVQVSYCIKDHSEPNNINREIMHVSIKE